MTDARRPLRVKDVSLAATENCAEASPQTWTVTEVDIRSPAGFPSVPPAVFVDRDATIMKEREF
jgi:hypothetical protein